MFDAENPSTTYRQFRKDVIATIDEAEVDYDEIYPTALFIVSKDGTGHLLYAYDLDDDDEDVHAEEILFERMPQALRDKDAKFYAVVLPGMNQQPESRQAQEMVVIAMGNVEDTEVLVAPVYREKYEYAVLDDFESQPVMNYLPVVSNFRRAVTWQG